MDQSTLITIMTVAVSISAIAMVAGACFLFGMYKAASAIRDRVLVTIPKVEAVIPKVEAVIPKIEALIPKVDALLPKFGALLDESQQTVAESRELVVEIRRKSNQILDSGQKQMQTVESLLSDASDRTKRQLDHAEMIVSGTLEKAEHTVGLVHKGIMKPIRGVTGVAAGLSAAMQVLFRAGRANPDEVTIDEEMFI